MYDSNYKSKTQETINNPMEFHVPQKEVPFVYLFFLIKLLIHAKKGIKGQINSSLIKNLHEEKKDNDKDLNSTSSLDPTISEPRENMEYNSFNEDELLPISNLVESDNNTDMETNIDENDNETIAPLSPMLKDDYSGVKVCAILPTGIAISGEVVFKYKGIVSLKHDNKVIFVNEKNILYFY